MKFEEVFSALREGKKIRRECWEKGKYYILDKKYRLTTNEGHGVLFPSLSELMFDDWEIVEEKEKKKGKLVKLRDLTKEQYIRWLNANCEKLSEDCCDDCPFEMVFCGCWEQKEYNGREDWMGADEYFSDKFLDQEIEVPEEEEVRKYE